MRTIGMLARRAPMPRALRSPFFFPCPLRLINEANVLSRAGVVHQAASAFKAAPNKLVGSARCLYLRRLPLRLAPPAPRVPEDARMSRRTCVDGPAERLRESRRPAQDDHPGFPRRAPLR